MTTIAEEKYVRLTTFTKAGARKETAVWIADLGDGKVGFTTGLNSWKVKRIRNTSRVELAPSSMKGKVADGAVSVTATATIATGADAAAATRAIKAKYGFQYTLARVADRTRSLVGKGDESCAVVIALD